MGTAMHKVYVVLALALTIVITGCSHNGHQVTGEFTTKHTNDAALQEWLKAQPTISTQSIRIARQGLKVSVVFKTRLDGPERLDPERLRSQFMKLGYLDGTISFVPCNIKR